MKNVCKLIYDPRIYIYIYIYKQSLCKFQLTTKSIWCPIRINPIFPVVMNCHCNLNKRLYIYIYIYTHTLGISAGNRKQRWYSHRHPFSNPKLRYQTALSKYFWGLKDQGLSPQIKWKILRHSSAASSFNGRCNLCLDEKISIINFKNRKLLLNERNEVVFKCRHRGKFKLS